MKRKKGKTNTVRHKVTDKVAQRLKQLRKSKGFTSGEAFAFSHGINRSQYISYERGIDLRISSLTKICEAHGITLEQFFSEGFE